MTVSILSLKVTSENDGAELICRAANPWFSGGALEDKRIISVACKCTLPSVCGLLQKYYSIPQNILYYVLYEPERVEEFIEFNVTSRFA